jgi:hypothetical protein
MQRAIVFLVAAVCLLVEDRAAGQTSGEFVVGAKSIGHLAVAENTDGEAVDPTNCPVIVAGVGWFDVYTEPTDRQNGRIRLKKAVTARIEPANCGSERYAAPLIF